MYHLIAKVSAISLIYNVSTGMFERLSDTDNIFNRLQFWFKIYIKKKSVTLSYKLDTCTYIFKWIQKEVGVQDTDLLQKRKDVITNMKNVNLTPEKYFWRIYGILEIVFVGPKHWWTEISVCFFFYKIAISFIHFNYCLDVEQLIPSFSELFIRTKSAW